MSDSAGNSPRIVRINGPVVMCDRSEQFSMGDRVAVGHLRLVGEVIRILPAMAVVQVYEETTSLQVGEPVRSSGAPLSVLLGPGLLAAIFDGIQRPLDAIAAKCGDFISRGIEVPALDMERRWPFRPLAEAGNTLAAGSILGEVQENEAIVHRIMLPPSFASGRLLWIAEAGDYRHVDPIGEIDTGQGRQPLYLMQRWPVRIRLPVQRRLKPGVPLITGQRTIDTFFSIAKGGTAAMPGGFGTGKTVTQHNLAKWCDADIIVYIGCGERGNEMTGVLNDFPKLVDPRSNHPLIERTVMIANTSNMPVAAREASIYTGITIAEYYRDQGYDVALMADSTSRWAEALREISGRLEEMPAEEGFPAYLPTRTAEFYERAGRVETLAGAVGSVTAIGAVSPPGGDFSEPVTLHTQRFVKAYWALDKGLANARFFPAIDPLASYSEYGADLAQWWRSVDGDWRQHRDELLRLLLEADKLKGIVRIMGEDGLADRQRKILLCDRLIKEGFLQQSAFSEKDRYASPEKQAAMLALFVETIRCILDDIAPAVEIAAKYRLDRLIRLKDAIGSDELEQMRAWVTQ